MIDRRMTASFTVHVMEPAMSMIRQLAEGWHYLGTLQAWNKPGGRMKENGGILSDTPVR
ncbi:MAG TPA: hypothetical protein DEF41_01850 [Desulfovibrio sp.]|uniref:Uncharacterized protein n=1 Tax=Nitratidesulfovibrio vulgaris (strain ATCC 29579 / DSM 644 / CCUG 34227 / NCIMB 8303 / VKM B-1760 / Hildenborough) TaxID=882 RepID=Q72G43_NITV2|nr:hypothetical protein DVU_0017 [Nitratidesulfovibrio vulgaris str. Hildenborough]HBW14898.1 hypothetical protein [Desulfovibrio sp.]